MSKNYKNCGRKPNQRMKAYLLLQYLLRNTDDEHAIPMADLETYLQDVCGIDAERRSIYKDIHEINIANLMLDETPYSEAEEALAEDEDLALIRYNNSKKNSGYYICDQRRSLSFEDARLLSECVYAARFIPQKDKKHFIELISESLSEHQAARLDHDVVLLDAQSTINSYSLRNIDKIKEALSGKGCKIQFQYLKHELQNAKPKLTERRGGASYVVSPYAMMIENGNYYLRAIDEHSKSKKMKMYRIDRMRKIKLSQETRTETKDSKSLDMRNYARRVFFMFEGTSERVTIRFVNSSLDAAVDRFGVEDVIYSQIDDTHFTITATVDVSEAFYGWLCGFGRKAKILSPSWVAKGFSAHIQKIAEMYQS
ncbi:MAG: WYL domain-containing protein [Ruminococcaceae bacterium]|nr:WYL domain-containing protein [Oscillospiraceae bacterium]